MHNTSLPALGELRTWSSLLGNGKRFQFLLRNVCHHYWETFLFLFRKKSLFLQGKILSSKFGKCFPSLLGNFSHPYWGMFLNPTGKGFPSLLGNVSHSYWVMFPIPTEKCFPSLLGKVPHLSRERFPILTGNISHTVGSLFHPYGWETFTLPNGILFSLLVVTIS